MAHVNLSYYRNQILPWFKGKPISDITRRDVLQWHASLHGVPFAADRSAPILSVIFKQAEAYGYRPEGSNPCAGIKRCRRGNGIRITISGVRIRRPLRFGRLPEVGGLFRGPVPVSGGGALEPLAPWLHGLPPVAASGPFALDAP